MTAAELALALVRTTLTTGVAACLAVLLLSSLKVASPRVHRIAWALVVLQGWLLIPWTFEIKSPPVERAVPIVGGVSDAESHFLLGPSSASETHPTFALARTQPKVAPLALLAWFTGAALAATLAAARYVRILRTLPLGAALEDPQWQAEWRNTSGAMPSSSWACLRRATKPRPPRVDLRITDRLGPLLAYIPFTYLILAPRPLWTVLTSAERSAILRHELAHLRRRDLWKSLALRALALPQWFNPLVWLAVRRFDEAAEWACDDAATAAHPNEQLTLANSLLHAAEFATATPCGAVAVQGGVLSRRIHRLVTPRFKEESTMRKLAVPALLAALAAVQLIRIERVSAESAVEQASHVDAPTAPPTTPTRREYKESAWPRYIVEPPDVLAIDAIKLVPKTPHHIETFDAILVRVAGAFPENPIDDTYSVDADGSINLGPTYGRIRVAGLTIEEAEERIRADLSKILTHVKASASLIASAGAQQITGQYLVAMDGRVNLGVYGSVYVAGLTIEETCEAIEKKLAEKLEQPQVSVDVLSYNSKVYYVITKGGAKGDNVVRAPITGNDTVLDAIANLGGMSVEASTKIWIARPAPNGGNETILLVNWSEIARGAEPATNYQLMPGDRLFIEPSLTEPKPPVENPDAPPTPATRVGELRVRDVITVLVDYSEAAEPAAAYRRQPPSFRIACEIREIRPNGNLSIEGKQTIHNNDEEWRVSLSGEVRREAIQPDGTVSSRSIVNLNIDKRVVEAEAASAVPAAPAPASPPGTVTRHDDPKQILFKISVIQDSTGDMAQLSRDLRESGSMRSDATTMLGALGVFDKHGLIKTLASPTVVTVIGRTASFEVAGNDGDQPIYLALNPKSTSRDGEGRTVMVEIGTRKGEGRQRGVVLHAGETFVFATRHPQPQHDILGAGETYIVLTPEFVP